jgi:hypothetical protein
MRQFLEVNMISERAPNGQNVRTISQTYRLFLVDFPAELKPEHLGIPDDKQALLFAGLPVLHAIIGNVYDYFAHLAPTDNAHWSDEDYCCLAIEGAVKLLWAL